MNEPKTLQEAIVYFSDPDRCREYLVAVRWPNGVHCPRCGSAKVTFQPKYNRWQCGSHHPRRQFTLKTGTIFEDSPLGLDKWFCAMWLVVNRKNGVSSYEMHRALGVTQKTAWFMDRRIRLALQGENDGRLSGYPDEQAYRYNHRGLTEDERFALAVCDVSGKRVTFEALTGGSCVEELLN